MRFIFWCTILFFSPAQAQANSFDLFEENGKVGLKNEQGSILIPAQYDALGWPEQSFSVHQGVVGYRMGNFWGLITTSNKMITPATYASITPSKGNLLVAAKKEPHSFRIKNGCIDTHGKTIIPFDYDGIQVIELRAIVYNRAQNKIQFGVIDFKNDVIIPLEYQSISTLGNLRFAVENFDGKKAIFSDQGKKITPFSLDEITPYKKDFAILIEGSKLGLIDRNGTIILPVDFQEIEIEDDGTIRIRKPNQWKILSAENQLVRELAVDSIKTLAVNRYALSTNDSLTLVDGDFESISNESFSMINPFLGDYTIFEQNGLFGAMDMNGAILLKAEYDNLLKDNTHFISMKIENGITRWSLLNNTGETISQKSYDQILPFNGKFYPVKKRGFWGAMNAVGKEIITCVFDSLLRTDNEFVAVKFHNQYGVIDMDENWRVIPQPNELRVVYTDRYLQTIGSTTYLKTFTGGIIYFTENSITPRSTFLEETISNGSAWRISYDGQITYRQHPPETPYQEIFSETEGLRAIKKDGRYGFIDDRGRLRIANRYENVKPFTEKLAAMQILNRWGFIDHSESIIIQPVYESVTAFEKGISIVQLKGKFGLIDITGQVLTTPIFESITPLPSGRFLAKKNNLVGLIDKNGNLIVQVKFDTLEDLDNGFVIIEKNGKFGLTRLNGVSTIPLIYDFLSFDAINNRYFGLEKSDWKVFSK